MSLFQPCGLSCVFCLTLDLSPVCVFYLFIKCAFRTYVLPQTPLLWGWGDWTAPSIGVQGKPEERNCKALKAFYRIIIKKNMTLTYIRSKKVTSVGVTPMGSHTHNLPHEKDRDFVTRIWDPCCCWHSVAGCDIWKLNSGFWLIYQAGHICTPKQPGRSASWQLSFSSSLDTA